MKKPLQYLILVLGFLGVVSSLLSIRPAAESRYRELVERDAIDPSAVTADEWVISKADESLSAVMLIFIGIPSFFVVTIGALVATGLFEWIRPGMVIVGSSWLCLGAVLHAIIWLV